jgi:hypothetical protein
MEAYELCRSFLLLVKDWYIYIEVDNYAWFKNNIFYFFILNIMYESIIIIHINGVRLNKMCIRVLSIIN